MWQLRRSPRELLIGGRFLRLGARSSGERVAHGSEGTRLRRLSFSATATFDCRKNARNIAERGLSFERVTDLDWIIREDSRRDYRERRLLVMARFDRRLHAVVVTPRGEDLGVISFRRANRREVRLYGKKDDG